jgi:hypothetical protein
MTSPAQKSFQRIPEHVEKVFGEGCFTIFGLKKPGMVSKNFSVRHRRPDLLLASARPSDMIPVRIA